MCERIEFVKAEQNMTKSKTAGFSLEIIAVDTTIYCCCCCCCYYSIILIIRPIVIVIVSSSFICYLSCTYCPIWPHTTVIFPFGWPKYGSIYAKNYFSCYFIFTGDFLWIVCCLSAFNREEDVVFGYVRFVNIECCILSIRTHGSHLTFVQNALKWVWFG